MARKIIIVSLSGKQGAGKDTLGECLQKVIEERYMNVRVKLMKFASVIYEMHDAVRKVGDLYGIPRKKPKDGPLLQLLGTDWGRHTISDDVWIKALKNKIRNFENSTNDDTDCVVILTDCRFENEFNNFLGSFQVRLICPEDIRKRRCSMWRENTSHPSETGLDHYEEIGVFDLTINTNTNTVAQSAEMVLDHIGHKLQSKEEQPC